MTTLGRVKTTWTSEGERGVAEMYTLLNNDYNVKVSTKGGGGQKYPKFCLRGLYRPPLLKNTNTILLKLINLARKCHNFCFLIAIFSFTIQLQFLGLLKSINSV